jgi:hypothetical protein
MITSNCYNTSKNVVGTAHDICNGLLLFDAVNMEEWEVRLVLESNNVVDMAVQDRYLDLVKEYEKKA